HQLSSSDGGGHEEGARLDAVGDDCVGGPVKRAYSADAQRGRASALDLRAHLDQQISKVSYLRLARGVLDEGFALGKSGGHEHVFGPGYGDLLKDDMPAAQVLVRRHARLDVTVGRDDLRAHPFQRLQVQVDRARAGCSAGTQAWRSAGPRPSQEEPRSWPR